MNILNKARPSKSCGCHRDGRARRTHGQSKTKLYRVWNGMLNRCINETVESYKHYGKRGISVCAEWREFQPFYSWALSNGYKAGLMIDRIDNDGNYEPANCRFVDLQTQCNNRRTTRYLTAFGETKRMCDWLDDPRITLSRNVIKLRLSRGWPDELALTQPLRKEVM